MKLLHVIASMDPKTGGPCQGVRNISPHLIESGHTVEVVCLDDPKAEYLKTESLKIHALGNGRGGWSYHPALRPWLKTHLPRFDAVLLRGLWQYPGYVLSQLSQRFGKKMPPYFVYPHGMLDPWFQRAPERRLKAIRNRFYWKLIEQHVVRNAKALLFTCAEEMRLAQETFYPYRPQNQINVGYGIERPPEFHTRMAMAFAQKCPTLNGSPYFLFLSRIHPKKGIDLLIKAYVAFLSTFNSQLSTFPKLVIAGPGVETDYGKQMQQLASNLCPPASVLWPGMLAGEAKWGALYGCEAFVLPSHQENFGIAVVEALACGKPVLISKEVNIWREIEEDKAGLASEDTLEGVTELLQRWKNLPLTARHEMTLAAKSSYTNRFGIVPVAQNLVATIKQFIENPADAETK